MKYKYIFCISAFFLFSCSFNTERSSNQQSIKSGENDKLYGNQITLKARFIGFDTTVTVLFWNTIDSINEIQKKNFQGFIENQDSLFPIILRAIFEEYKKSYFEYKKGWTMTGNISDAELEKYLPKPTTAENLKAFITPGVIHIQNKKECKEGTLGIEFDCTWDIENGVGVMIENWKVVKTGAAETSYF